MKEIELMTIMGKEHTTQILDILDSLGVDWKEKESFYQSALDRGEKNIFTGQPITAEQAANELWADLHRAAETAWLKSITREQAKLMEDTVGQNFYGRIVVCEGLDFLAHTLTQEWDRVNREKESQ